MTRLLPLFLLLLAGCDLVPEELEEQLYDPDGDGHAWPEDCDSSDATRFPGAEEIWYDGIDQDCAGDDDYDQDGDGWIPDGYQGMTTLGVPGSGTLPAGDCWDEPLGPDESPLTGAEINPAAEESHYDGVDQDCDGLSDYDADLDGHDHADFQGDDCDDADPSIHPDAAEIWYDGVDQDCDENDCDQDGDGLEADPQGQGFCDQVDCDDTDAEVGGTGSDELWYDGIDQDCDGNDGDQDGDGYWVADYAERVAAAGGEPLSVPVGAEGDCWDVPVAVGGIPEDFQAINGFDQLAAPEVHPGAGDTWYDGVDQDCAGDDDFDQDGDGSATDELPDRDGLAGADCDDGSALIAPDAIESWYDGVDQNCDGNDGDLDGDGFWAEDYDERVASSGGTPMSIPVGREGDCDDLDSSSWPGAPEYCDGVDSDCDGSVDDEDALDISTWYADADGDGYGDASSAAVACTQPTGFVADATDCDDGEAVVHPGATEVCDGLDDDCDGLADHDDPDVTDATIWYPDADADGYGDAASAGGPFCSGAEPVDWQLDATDCDDADPAQFPGADELCNGEDDDCDGVSDEDDALDAATWYADADGDGYGDSGTVLVACEAPVSFVSAAIAPDCHDGDASINPGATELPADGVDQDCDGDEVCFEDADLDGFGVNAPVASSDLDCLDTGESTLTTDCDDGDASIFPGATELAVDGVDQDCDGLELCYEDADGDGYGGATTTTAPDLGCSDSGLAASSTDCADGDASIFPGATELAVDGVDQDCDGLELCYEDADGDGVGSTTTLASADTSCTAAGLAIDPSDCDDGDAAVNPSATEVAADGVDSDCDGVELCYQDEDFDGHGSSATLASGDADCEDSGESALSDDCDDADAGAYPGAPENIADGIDQDCDGMELCFDDGDGDGYGSASTSLSADTDCGDSGEATRSEDCDDAAAGTYPGADELCNGVDDDCDGDTDEGAVDAPTWYADADGDSFGDASATLRACSQPAGHVSDSSDCNDGDGAIHPAGTETCDGVDQDCDGAVDEGATDATTWYLDADADGHGLAGTEVQACGQPSGHVGSDDDCDDGDAGVSPSAAEYCDGHDDDCDGTVDEDDALDATSWSYDADGDGFGDPSIGRVSCGAPTGYVAAAAGEDCDDASTAVNPGATELCNGVDDDCDGTVDEDDAADALTWYADVDVDGYGDAASILLSCSQPSGTSTLSSDCDDSDAMVNPGAAEICGNGVDDDCDDAAWGCTPLGEIGLGEADALLLGVNASDSAGFAVTLLGDQDGDGLDELVVSATACDDGSYNAGAVYLLRGPVSGTVDLASAPSILLGEAAGDAAGTTLASAFDLDGDGLDELLVGAPSNDAGGGSAGAVYLLHGPASGSSSLASALAQLVGEDSGDVAGTAIHGAGDTDGDNLGDLLIGAPGQDGGGTNAGAAYLLLGPVTGDVVLSSAHATLRGEISSDAAGGAVAGGVDVDGDGLDDLLVGAVGHDGAGVDRGAAYLFLGPVSGVLSLSSADARVLGDADGDGLGASLALIEDADGDGLGDLLLGAPEAAVGGQSAAGAVYLGLALPVGDLAAADLEAKVGGEAAGDGLGDRLAAAGDVDGDGASDWLLGASASSVVGSESGAVYLFLGAVAGELAATSADARFLGEAAGDAAGASLAGAGDADGDGFDDLLIGIVGDDSAAAEAGAAALILGGGL